MSKRVKTKTGEITEKNFHKILRQSFEWAKIKWLPFQIFLRGYNWKKRGYKGKVEVWDAKGKFVSAHKTIQDAVDSVPNRSVTKEAKNDNKKKGRRHKIPD